MRHNPPGFWYNIGMGRFFATISFCFLASCASASWYWPFGDSEEEPPRLSELVQKASDLIADASDLASDGKTTDAVAKYREALVEIARVEREHPELADKAVGNTLKTKRAYVEATIDALIMNQARENAKSVGVSETSELERRLAQERSGGKAEQDVAAAPQAEEPRPETAKKPQPKAQKKPAKKAAPARPLTPREEVMKAIADADYAKADRLIAALLNEKPNDAAALNLRAAKETAEGKFAEAEKTLDSAIRSNPRDHFAYYNMAILKLQTREDDRDGARRYYETGRALGGPEDAEIEEMLK